MEILGVGAPELIAIFIIMLIVAGPKRMIQWAYLLGRYTARMRKMWAEAMTYVQKEFDAAGIDVELPKEIPTKATMAREITRIGEKAMAPVTKPVQETVNEVNKQVKELKTQTNLMQGNGNKSSSDSDSSGNGKPDLGTWSSTPKADQ